MPSLSQLIWRTGQKSFDRTLKGDWALAGASFFVHPTWYFFRFHRQWLARGTCAHEPESTKLGLAFTMNNQKSKRTESKKPTGKKSAFNEKLTAAEAKHLLMTEGGEMTLRETLIQIAWALAVSGALAWAIVKGQATIWHLVVPLVAEYLCLVVALPLIYLYMRHPDLKSEFTKCSRALLLFVIVIVGTIVGRAIYLERPVIEQLKTDSQWLSDWIINHQVHWALLVAVVHAGRSLRKSVRNLIEHGPPFIGGGMGCAMKIVVLVFAVIFVPVFGMLGLGILKDFGVRSFPPASWGPPQNWVAPVWVAWALLLIADLATVWFLWDIQSKLKQEGHLEKKQP